MRLTTIRAALAVSALFLSLSAPPATAADFALGAKASTLGFGLELTAGLSEQVDIRLGVNAGSYEETREASDIEYEAEAKARTATALLDWHPGGGGFRLTGGLLYNDSEIEGRSLIPSSGFYDIAGVRVPANLLGTLNGTIEFDPISPYAGFGWGNAIRSSRPVTFSFDLGVAYMDGKEVTLTPVLPPGSPLNDPIARALLAIQLEREAREIEEEDLADYDFYPIVSLGLSYRF